MRIKGKLRELRQGRRAEGARCSTAFGEDQAEEIAFAKRFWHDLQDIDPARGGHANRAAGSTAARFDEIRELDLRGRRAAPHPRLGAVHPRRDPGPGHRDARHLGGRPAARLGRGRVDTPLHAALQLPAVLGRRGALPARPRPARDRPRRPGRALAAADDSRRGELALHDPHRLRHPRVERLLLDGHGLRRLAGADGRRRAAEGAGGRHRHGPGQGRATASRS